MRTLPLIAALLLSISIAHAQLDSNSITVTAYPSTPTGVQPDQAVYIVQLSTGLDMSLDDVIAALQGSGITSANFQGLIPVFFNTITGPGPSGPPTPMLSWSFRFAVPFSRNKDILATLNTLQQSIAKKNNGTALSFYIQGAQSSMQSQQTCSVPDLLTDARAQAQKLAAGAGVSVGNILAMSSPVGGGFAPVPGLGSSSAPSAVPLCSLTVKFALSKF